MLTIAGIGALVACGAGDSAGGGEIVVRDSAGITVVENSGDGAWEEGQAWRVSAEPMVQIGVLNGAPEYRLFEVRDAVRLSDGRIVIANTGTQELRYYDGNGRHLRTVGGEGGGPGEFQGLFAIGAIRGDTVYAWDIRNARLSVFDAGGTFVTSVSMAGEREVSFAQMQGVFEDGSILLDAGFSTSGSSFNTGVNVLRDTVTFLRVGRGGAPLDTLGPFPGDERVAVIQNSGGMMRVFIRGLPFGREALVAVEGNRSYMALSGRWEIAVYAPTGQLEKLVRLERARPPVTSADVEAYVNDRLENAGSEDDRVRLRTTFESIEYPDQYPAFSDLRVDARGNLWLREFVRPAYEGPRRWSIFSAEGRLLGTVETPERLQVVQIGRGFVLGITRSELGVQQVRLYELIKPGAVAGGIRNRANRSEARG